MTHRKKITSQSGFMSVEAIATTLFYLIMVSIVSIIAAQVINSGKMAASLNAIGMLRVNAQYVGVNSGSSYVNISSMKIHDYVPLIATDGAPTPTYTLPTSHIISIAKALEKDGNPDKQDAGLTAAEAATNAYFTMQIVGLNPNDCRKVAYYGIGGGYGVYDLTGDQVLSNASQIESSCTPDPINPVTIRLTSK